MEKVVIEQETVLYKIVAGEISFSGMKKVDSWNGLTRYSGDSGMCIIIEDADQVFEFMSWIGGVNPKEGNIIMASGEILEALTKQADSQ